MHAKETIIKTIVSNQMGRPPSATLSCFS